MGLWPPKKKPLYAPMLATFGGGSSRGFNPGGGGGGIVDLTMTNAFASNNLLNASAGSNLASNFGFWTIGSNATVLTSQSDFNMITDGIYRFTLPAGDYTYSIRGGDGSGQYHYEGYEFGGNLSTNTDLVALAAPANHGTGQYSGGGGSVLILSTSNNIVYNNIAQADIALVAGGGSGGYSGNSNLLAPTAPNTSHNQTRLGANVSSQSYDGAASIFNNYTPYIHNNGNTGRPGHFVQGWNGGYNGDCGSTQRAGFGGGGGSCPGAGGGYPGGLPGTNQASSNGINNANNNQIPGGSGRSFYNNSNLWSISVNSNTAGTLQNNQFAAADISNPNGNRIAAAQGFINITTAS